MSELATREQSTADLDLTTAPFTWRTLQAIAGTEMVPRSYRNKPEAILACILMGRELGMGPMESLRRIDVIDGSPTPSAEWMVARVFEEGHAIYATEQTAERCTVVGKRFRDGEVVAESSFTFTIDMARRAGLTNKNNWKNYPEAMLFWRAVGQLCRQLFPDVLGGLKNLPDELGSADWEPPSPAEVETVETVDVETGEVLTAEVVESDDEDAEAAEAEVVDEPGPLDEAPFEQAADPEPEVQGDTPKQRAQARIEGLADEADAWAELYDLLCEEPSMKWTNDQLEESTRYLYLLMHRVRLAPEDRLHRVLRSNFGVEHVTNLAKTKPEGGLVRLATMSWEAAWNKVREAGEGEDS